MRIKVILNPSADLGRGLRSKEIIIAEGEKHGELDLVLSEYPGQAISLAHQAAADGYDVVVAAGGDGTIHEVVNGLLQNGKADSKLAIIPIGTGNDFAYALGISLDIPRAIEAIYRNRVRTVDLAQVVDDRGVTKLFSNNFGIGFDASVVIRVESITSLHGFPKYLWAVLKTLALDFRPYPVNMRFDDVELDQDVLFVAFGIGSRHGGGFMLTPGALNDDNRIDTCTVNSMSRLQALRFLNSAVQGTHVTNPLVTMRQTKRIEITCADPLPIHIDGEVFSVPEDNVHQVVITSLPAALEVLV
jgi:YegS/Rv2252/BmrU family lipid kinase